MFCPQCGSTQSDELRFCKNCGTNLAAVLVSVTNPEKVERFDWDRTWVAEMLMTRDQKDRVRGITPEMKRQREIKAGMITSSSGIALTILIWVIMGGVIASGGVSDKAIAILSRLWVVGIVPLLVGLALIFNGVFISKRESERNKSDLLAEQPDNILRTSTTNELGPAEPFSVTDGTTRHLDDPIFKKQTKSKP